MSVRASTRESNRDKTNGDSLEPERPPPAHPATRARPRHCRGHAWKRSCLSHPPTRKGPTFKPHRLCSQFPPEPEARRCSGQGLGDLRSTKGLPSTGRVQGPGKTAKSGTQRQRTNAVERWGEPYSHHTFPLPLLGVSYPVTRRVCERLAPGRPSYAISS